MIRYDQRGHGTTAVPAGPYTFEQLANDAVALLDALDIPTAHFVGLSMGGMTALGLALDHADRIASIAACNCVAGYGPDGVKVWDERIAAVSETGLEPIIDATVERWFTPPTRAARPDDMAAVRTMIAATPVQGYLGCCGALKHLAYQDRLAGITLPTLFIAGTHDIGAPAAAMREMHARVAGSRYVELAMPRAPRARLIQRFPSCSQAWAARNTTSSSPSRPVSIMPTGSPCDIPAGTLIDGWPVASNGAVLPIIGSAFAMISA